MTRKTVTIVFLLFCMFPFEASAQLLVGGGNVRYEPKGAKPVLFHHERHVNANGRKCSACHFGIFQMEKGSNRMNMSKITKGQFCGTCHNGRKAFDVDDRKHCVNCHK